MRSAEPRRGNGHDVPPRTGADTSVGETRGDPALTDVVGTPGPLVGATAPSGTVATGHPDERERQLARAEEVAGIGSWAWDVANDRITWSPGLYRIFGLQEGDLEPTYGGYLALVHPEDVATVMEAVGGALANGQPFHFEHRVIHPDGSIRWIEARGEVESGQAGAVARMVGTGRDITDEHVTAEVLSRRATQLRLLSTVATAANQAETLRDALQATVDAVCRATAWPVGHVYVPADDGTERLVPSDIWHFEDPAAYEVFRQVTLGTVLAFGEGLPGIVAASREPTWFPHLLVEPNFPRTRYAARLGIGCGFAFPVLVGEEVVAVLEFFDREPTPPDEPFLAAMNAVAGELARVAERERAAADLRESEAKSRAILDTVTEAYLGMDAAGLIAEWNAAAERLFGWAAAEVVGKPMARTLLPPRLRAAHRRRWDRYQSTGEIGQLGRPVEVTMLHRSGREIAVEITVWPQRRTNERRAYAFVRRLRTPRSAAGARRHLAETILDNLAEGVVAVDETGRTVYVNETFRVWSGGREEIGELSAAVGAGHDGGLSARDRVSTEAAADPVDAASSAMSIPFRRVLRGRQLRDHDLLLEGTGGPRLVRVNARAVMGHEGRTVGAVATLRDVTEQRAAGAHATHRSLHDELTGLPNRVLFLDRVEQALHAETHPSVAVMWLDLDGFRFVNERLGHAGADLLLADVARLLGLTIRPQDTLARVGDDEVAVLISGVAATRTAEVLAQRLLDAVVRASAETADGLMLTGSLGIAIAEPPLPSARALVGDAEVTMRRAKANGGARFESFSVSESAGSRFDDERALAGAQDRGELVVHFQPSVSLGDGRMVGAEALVRWQRPGHGLVPPGSFIPLAEATGLIVPIGAWVLGEACRQAAAWSRAAPDRRFRVSVNVSARQFESELTEAVRSALASSGLAPDLLVLEVTESVVMRDVDAAVATLRDLKALGIRVAVDDFGTGYSSLAYLRRLPLDELKVDRSFVDGLGHDPEDTAIVAAVVAMAQALDLYVVAEGVETPDQADALRDLGCDLAQGWHFGRPMTADQILILVKAEAERRQVGPSAAATELETKRSERLRTVLVVDDQEEMRHLTRLSLATAGFIVHVASTGREAIRVAQGLQPGAIVLDLDLPDLHGFDVCAALRADAATMDSTIVMLTGAADAADKVKAFTLGADDYLVKPFSPRDLASRVQAAIRRRAVVTA